MLMTRHFLGTDVLAAITEATHPKGFKATWPYDDRRRNFGITQPLAVAGIRVGRTWVPNGVLAAMESAMLDLREGGSDWLWPGQNSPRPTCENHPDPDASVCFRARAGILAACEWED